MYIYKEREKERETERHRDTEKETKSLKRVYTMIYILLMYIYICVAKSGTHNILQAAQINAIFIYWLLPARPHMRYFY